MSQWTRKILSKDESIHKIVPLPLEAVESTLLRGQNWLNVRVGNPTPTVLLNWRILLTLIPLANLLFMFKLHYYQF
jgi:hypothetical protein